MKTIGIADTMFACVDMFAIAKQAVKDSGENIRIERYTVPGFKDLPVACKKLLEEYHCDICIALGMAGDKKIDEQCAHEASQGIIQAQLMANKHILGIFVHMGEAKNKKELLSITKNRVYDHTKNALMLLKGKEALSRYAGKGVRQGKENYGSIE